MNWKFLKLSGVTFLGMFFTNFLFQAILLREWNASHLEGIRKSEADLNFVPLIVDYLLLSVVLTYLLIFLNKSNMMMRAFVIGVFIGIILFVHFGILNYFLLPSYPIPMIFSDSIASAFAFGVTAVITTYFARKWYKEPTPATPK